MSAGTARGEYLDVWNLGKLCEYKKLKKTDPAAAQALWEANDRNNRALGSKAAEMAEKERIARAEMEALWNNSRPAPPSHPYLRKHGIRPCGARLHDGKLTVRMHDYSGKIESLLCIDQQTGKEQVKRIDSIIAGFGFCIIGETTNTDEIYIVTRFISGAIIHEATGGPVMVIWDPNMIYDAAVYAKNEYGEESLSLVLCLEPRHNNDDTLLFFREAACAADATGAMLAFLPKGGGGELVQ